MLCLQGDESACFGEKLAVFPTSSSFVHILPCFTPSVTKSGVWLLLGQKPIMRPGWWKAEFALFWMTTTGVLGGEQMPVQRLPTPLPVPWQSRAKSFYRWREEAICRNSIQSALTVILNLVIGGQTSIILIVLGSVNLQFHGWFVSIALKPTLGIVAAHVLVIIWLSC